MRVRNLRTGEELATLNCGDIVCDAFYLNDSTIYVRFPDGEQIWSRRRPEHWWGVAWLPEFWLTAALGLLLVWSLRGDAIRFRIKPEKATPV